MGPWLPFSSPLIVAAPRRRIVDIVAPPVLLPLLEHDYPLHFLAKNELAVYSPRDEQGKGSRLTRMVDHNSASTTMETID
jgi:hypothetical protein